MSIKYNNGKIYKLVCEDGCYYIGATIQKLNHIFNSHKKSSKKVVCRVYDHINIIGWDKVQIELVELYPCNNKQELNKREQYYIDQANHHLPCLNNDFESESESESESETESESKSETESESESESETESESKSESETESESEYESESKSENKYQNGKIYKLVCKDGHYYIGSTIQELKLRFNSHKSSSSTNNTSRVYTYINTIGWDKVKIKLIEKYPCELKSNLNEREEYYINKSKTDILCLNINRAYLSEEKRRENMKVYYEENKETIIESHREYNEENREKVDAYHVQYRLDNAEKRREYNKQYVKEHQEQVKETKKKYKAENREKNTAYWREYNNKEENKEKIQKYKEKWAKKYKEENIELIAKKRNEKRIIREEKKQERIKHDRTIIQCICGGSYQNYQKKRHEENKKHITFITNIEI